MTNAEKIKEILKKNMYSDENPTHDYIDWAYKTKNTISIEVEINDLVQDIQSLIEEERNEWKKVIQALRNTAQSAVYIPVYKGRELMAARHVYNCINFKLVELGIIQHPESNILQDLTQGKEQNNG